jgi:hypothetical protein
MYMYAYIYIYIYTYRYEYTYTGLFTCIHICIDAYMHTNFDQNLVGEIDRIMMNT